MIKVLFILIFLAFGHSISASIDPFYKEAIQRGYVCSSDTVTFPDGSKCSIDDFNNSKAGKIWMTDDYCIEEGNYVWDDERCCGDLISYLEEGHDGQSVCAQKKSWWEINYFSFWLGLLIPFAFFGYVGIQIRRRLKKNYPKN